VIWLRLHRKRIAETEPQFINIFILKNPQDDYENSLNLYITILQLRSPAKNTTLFNESQLLILRDWQHLRSR
jgi:hypothetical protein